MTTSDEYRRRAGECLLFTNYVTSERTRQLLVQMALGWQDLADHADQKAAERGTAREIPGSDRT